MNWIEEIGRGGTGELIVDNFAGGGGASLGIEQALGRPVDVAINHDPVAIAAHTANHPDTYHYCQDIFEVDPVVVADGRPIGLAWFSPDCTHFSRAKGATPRKKNIRSLAWVVIRWAAAVQPRVICLENVMEFQDWGPLNAKGQPDKKRKGETFRQWIGHLRALGYHVEYGPLVAADYGAPTTRKRFLLVARCDGQPIVWPEPTHGPGRPLPWRTAAECIDWSLPCPSIFERKRPLAENTLRRIAKGIERYVIDAADPFILSYYGPKGDDFRGSAIDEPLATQTTENRFGLVSPYIAKANHKGDTFRGQDARAPIQTLTAKNGYGVVMPHLVRHFGNSVGQDVEGPAPTITAGGGGKGGLVATFLAKHYGGVVGHGVERPLGTVTSKDHHSLVAGFLTKYRGTSIGSDARQPMPTLTSGGMHIGEVRAFLLKYYKTATGQALSEPAHTLTSKPRLGLVTVHGQDYQIVDIGLRMLQPVPELLLAQGFPANYKLPGTKAQQTALIGNSVPPVFAKALVEANYVHDAKAERAAV